MGTFSYRKKPVVVEAFKLPAEDAATETIVTPQWFLQAIVQGRIQVDSNSFTVRVVTPEGLMEAKTGDYIIQGVKGELYPCKADIFELTYEKVE